jgi:hypothetical protein
LRNVPRCTAIIFVVARTRALALDVVPKSKDGHPIATDTASFRWVDPYPVTGAIWWSR